MTETSLLNTILRPGQLSILFQPVFDIADGRRAVHYFECLTRGPEGTNIVSASVLFEYVRRKAKEATVDRLCVAGALRDACRLPGAPSLAINVHASTLERDPDFVPFLVGSAEARSIAPSRLTLEIVEHAPAWSGRGFMKAMEALKETGVRIALDDIGLGQSNYRMILDCHPDYFKLDAFLIKGCHSDVRRQAIIDSLVSLARRFGSRVIGEGVETQADLHALQLLEVELVQGYLLSRPCPAEEFRCLQEI
jgi:EAL domain-containing protein (putative c-di-GMP-specific phosphodiesterase class I)